MNNGINIKEREVLTDTYSQLEPCTPSNDKTFLITIDAILEDRPAASVLNLLYPELQAFGDVYGLLRTRCALTIHSRTDTIIVYGDTWRKRRLVLFNLGNRVWPLVVTTQHCRYLTRD